MADSTDNIRIADVLIPWRLASVILDIEDHQERSNRYILSVFILVMLSAILTLGFSIMQATILLACCGAATIYTGSLLLLCFIILNVLCLGKPE